MEYKVGGIYPDPVLELDDKIIEHVEYEVGETVKWCWSELHQNTYIIVLIDDRGALLKQNFGRGTILSENRKDRVPLNELEKLI